MEDVERIAVLRQAADRGWADLEAGRYDDIADDNLDDFIGQLGIQAATRAQSAG